MPKFTLLTYSKARTEIQVVRPVPGSDKRASYCVASFSTNGREEKLGDQQTCYSRAPCSLAQSHKPKKLRERIFRNHPV